MTPGFVFLIVLAAVSGPIDLLAGHGQKPKTAQKETQKQAYPGCWPGEPEIENPNPGKHRPVRLPPELVNVLSETRNGSEASFLSRSRCTSNSC
jgi:hypothetical protein